MDIVYGNRCQHMPENPRFYEAWNLQYLPDFCGQAVEKCKDFYHNPTKYLTNLRIPGKRAKKSERREAIALVLQVLFHYTQLNTFNVGLVNKRGKNLKSLNWQFYANKIGIGLKRLYRAIADLKKAGYLFITYRHTCKEEGYRKNAKIMITNSCLYHLGFHDHFIKKVQAFKERHLRKLAPNGNVWTEETQKEYDSIVKCSKKTASAQIKNLRDILNGEKKITPIPEVANQFDRPAPSPQSKMQPAQRHGNALSKRQGSRKSMASILEKWAKGKPSTE